MSEEHTYEGNLYHPEPPKFIITIKMSLWARIKFLFTNRLPMDAGQIGAKYNEWVGKMVSVGRAMGLQDWIDKGIVEEKK